MAQSKMTVTVVDAAGSPVTDIPPASFAVTEKTQHPVSAAVYKQNSLDVALMIETSAFTNSSHNEISRMAVFFINQLGPKERMSLIGFADAPETMQDFTTDKQALADSVGGLRFTSSVGMFDSVYQVLDRGFPETGARRVLLLISSGQEGTNRTKKNELVELAEKRQISIFALSLSGRGAFLDELTKETAGVLLSGRQMWSMEGMVKNLFTAFRGHWELTYEGSEITGKPLVEVKGKDKLRVSYLKQ